MMSVACLYLGSLTFLLTSEGFLPVYHSEALLNSVFPPTQGDLPEFIKKLHLSGIPHRSRFLFCL